jgi:hypothetical protein
VDAAAAAFAVFCAVGVARHFPTLLLRGQRFDRRRQLHAVVGRHGFASEQFHVVPVASEPGSPAAAARIALAGAVRIDHDLSHAFLYSPIRRC